MEPHAVPRQITTFEFKLIGFLTLKEFAYLIVFAGLAAIAYFLAPFEIAKYVSAALIFGIGLFFAFFRYNERAVDVWIKNLIMKLFSSSQYYYHKKDEPPAFLRDMAYDKQIATLHADAKSKLSSYLKAPEAAGVAEEKTEAPTEVLKEDAPTPEESIEPQAPVEPLKEALPPPPPPPAPVFAGIVKNNKDLPLPNILLYLKNKEGEVVRILKTNSHGTFATNRPLDKGSYVLEPKDSGNRFFFDTMNVDSSSTQQPLVIRSKEAL